MSRIFRFSFEEVTVSAAQDLFEVLGAAGKMLRIIGFHVSCANAPGSPPANQQLPIRARFLPATVTSGSGGASGTINKTDPGDAAASFAGEVNNTTKATTSGTAVVLGEWGMNIFGGLSHQFVTPPVVPPSTGFVIELLQAPSGTVKLSGTIEVEETG